MTVKTCAAVIIAASSISNMVNAGDMDWSTSSVAPINQNTIRAYGLKYVPTPKVLYNINFIFNERTRQFLPDASTLMVVDIAKYAEADLVRGGSLYDKWWKINGQNEPSETYSKYPEVGSKTGSTTWRCKECHGWDYKGHEGAYESGNSHYTGINGLSRVKYKSVAEIYNTISEKHFSLPEQDIWDLTKFLKEGLVDMNKYIIFTGAQSKSATGDVENGRILFEGTGGCLNCHGEDGNKIESISVGAVTNDNPWEGLHKIRFGQPGTKMPSAVKKGLSLQEQIDILTYAQTLPQIETEHH